MQRKVFLIIAAALALGAILAAAAVPAFSQTAPAATGSTDISSVTMPKVVLMAVVPGSMTGTNLTFTVPYSAKIYKTDGREFAAVTTMNKPLQCAFNVSSGRGRLSLAGILPVTAVIDDVNNSSIPVAGAAGLVALKDIRLTGSGKDRMTLECNHIAVYLSNGTAKSYKLDWPLRINYDLDRMTATVEPNPALSSVVADVYKHGALFPAGAKPVKLNSVLAAMRPPRPTIGPGR